MPAKRTYRSSGRRSGSKPVVAWYNDSVLVQSLNGTSQIVFDLFPAANLPVGYQSGFTVLRFLLKVTAASTAVLQAVNLAWGAYVYGRQAIGSPPDLILDHMDYYVRDGLHLPGDPVSTQPLTSSVDIRSARRIRGEDRSMHIQMRNTGANPLVFGLQWRALLKRS